MIENTGSEKRTEYVAPRSETEKKLVAIWCEVLGLESVGVLDNFFDLGGNSLKIKKISEDISEMFGTKIPVIIAFQYPNIQALAQYLDLGAVSYEAAADEEEDTSFDRLNNTLKTIHDNENE